MPRRRAGRDGDEDGAAARSGRPPRMRAHLGRIQTSAILRRHALRSPVASVHRSLEAPRTRRFGSRRRSRAALARGFSHEAEAVVAAECRRVLQSTTGYSSAWQVRLTSSLTLSVIGTAKEVKALCPFLCKGKVQAHTLAWCVLARLPPRPPPPLDHRRQHYRCRMTGLCRSHGALHVAQHHSLTKPALALADVHRASMFANTRTPPCTMHGHGTTERGGCGERC